jgi:hypothetical protein
MILSAVADTSQMMHDVIIPQTFDFQGWCGYIHTTFSQR